MKGDDKILAALNRLLMYENTAVIQYNFHAEFQLNNGYEEAWKYFHERMKDEKKHQHKLISRILFLEGLPDVAGTVALKLAYDITNQIKSDLEFEYACVQAYNEVIHMVTCEIPDNTTRHILNNILDDENEHVKELEDSLTHIKDIGIENYIANRED